MSSAEPKLEHHLLEDSPRGSSRSAASSPEPCPETEGHDDPQGPPQATQKRKGGRKPIYATSEERKQRNRQAQAAFRERRTEYIKQLEITIKQNEDNLQTLQQTHRAAADECLMLRYKNSLLERILLEKGIDVQAELQSKSEGSMTRRNTNSHSGVNAPPLQRAMLNRQQQQQQRRFPQGLAPKPDHGFRLGTDVQQNYSSSMPNMAHSTSPTLDQPTGLIAQTSTMLSSMDQAFQPQQFSHFQQSTQPMQQAMNTTRPPTNSYMNRMSDYAPHNMLDYASPISGEGDQSPYYPYMDTSAIEPPGKLNLPFSPYSE